VAMPPSAGSAAFAACSARASSPGCGPRSAAYAAKNWSWEHVRRALIRRASGGARRLSAPLALLALPGEPCTRGLVAACLFVGVLSVIVILRFQRGYPNPVYRYWIREYNCAPRT